MLIIRCTQKLLKELRITPSQDELQNANIDSWHADLLRIERRKCLLVTHDQTLYSLFIPGLKRPDFERLKGMFRQHLFNNLHREGFYHHQIERLLSEAQEIKIAKTNNRSVLGSMNELRHQIEYRVSRLGGLKSLNLISLNQELNHVPLSAIKYNYSVEVLKLQAK